MKFSKNQNSKPPNVVAIFDFLNRFHVKSEWQKNCKITTLCSLNLLFSASWFSSAAQITVFICIHIAKMPNKTLLRNANFEVTNLRPVPIFWTPPPPLMVLIFFAKICFVARIFLSSIYYLQRFFEEKKKKNRFSRWVIIPHANSIIQYF